MTMNPLPPQAYTKDMLAQAYNWLRSQPANIQDMAKSTDTLISLYHKAQMHGDSYLERPSLQNFKSELKNLAGMMGEFDGKNAQIPSSFSTPPAFSHVQQATFSNPSVQVTHQTTQYSQSQPTAHFTSPPLQLNNSHPTPAFNELDDKTSLMIFEIKEALNLSSEAEALRMLVSIGHQKIKSIL